MIRNPDKLFISLINKMLEKHGVDYEYVCKHEFIYNQPWYHYYTMTKDEAKRFEMWAKSEIKKILKCSDKNVGYEFEYFWRKWGLKVV